MSGGPATLMTNSPEAGTVVKLPLGFTLVLLSFSNKLLVGASPLRLIGTSSLLLKTSHHLAGSWGLVTISASWYELATHPNGSFADHCSAFSVCLRAARSTAKRRSEGTLGIPCLWTCNRSDRSSGCGCSPREQVHRRRGSRTAP